MLKNLNKQDFIKFIGMLSISMVSLGYVIFASSFAEIHIQLPFLDFPIFIGEILMMFCFMLFLFVDKSRYAGMNKATIFAMSYYIFVLLKVAYGYYQWGPLALRQAALFYYPVFALFGFFFFKKEFLPEAVKIIIFFAVIILLFCRQFYICWVFSLFSIALIMALSVNNRTFKFIMSIVLILFAPYKLFFFNARMMLISNFVSLLFLFTCIVCLINLRKGIKAGLILSFVFLLLIALIRFSYKGDVLSILDFKQMYDIFKERDAVVQSEINTFKFKDINDYKIYNPDINKISLIKGVPDGEEEEEYVKISYPEDTKSSSITALSGGQENVKNNEAIQLPTHKIKNLTMETAAPLDGQSNIKNAGADRLSESEGKRSGITASSHQQNALEEVALEQITEKEIDSSTVTAGVKGQTNVKNTRVKELSREEIDISRGVAILDGKNSIKDKGIDKVSLTPDREEDAIKNIAENGAINAVFRIFIWRDMFVDLIKNKPLFGFDLGKPFRSASIEIFHWAAADWERDGWISMHNSYLELIYRSGIAGVFFIIILFFTLFKMIAGFMMTKSYMGLILCGILINWLVAAFFITLMEFSYVAIPFWTIFGITLKYYETKKEPVVS